MSGARHAAAQQHLTVPATSLHASGDVVNPLALAERPIAAAMPWAVIAAAAAAYLISDALRVGGRPSTLVLAVCGLLILTSAGALLIARHTTSRAVQLALLIGAVVLTTAAAMVPALSEGIRAITMPAVILLAAYAGLTVPRSAVLLGTLLAGTAALHAATPEASAVEVVSLLALIAAAWAFGRFCGAVHRRARRLAIQLSRTDRLVHTLNRRGFTEELAYRLAQAGEHDPVAVMVVDLVDFKEVNQRSGAGEGDALLERVGDRLAAILPAGAIAGRLGGDEFAIALLGAGEDPHELARSVQTSISELHPARIGFTTAQHSLVDLSDLLRTADAASRRCREEDRSVQHLVAGMTSAPHADDRQPRPPTLTYTRLRELGGRPTKPTRRLIDGRAQRDGFLALAIAGIVHVIAYGVAGPETLAEQTVVYGGILWVAVCLGFAARGAVLRERVATGHDVMLAATLIACIGIGVAAQASGGVMSLMIGGLYLMMLVSSALVSGRSQYTCSAVIVTTYVTLLALAPMEDRWVAPFQLTLLVGAFGLGRVNRSALDAVTEEWLAVARRDQVTGLLNRFGFDEELRRVMDEAPAGSRYALFTFDLDRFRDVNTGGYQAGDAVLRQVASRLTDATAGGQAARRGADEFVAALPVADPDEADRLLATITAQVSGVHATSSAVALFPDDGATLDEVLRISDLRTRTNKVAQVATT